MTEQEIKDGEELLFRFEHDIEPERELRNSRVRYSEDWGLIMPVWIKITRFIDKHYEDEDLNIAFNVAYDRLGDGDGIEEFFPEVVNCIKIINKINGA